jgi:alkylation response protein AidB-like acyl-CoA dehydrogenase
MLLSRRLAHPVHRVKHGDNVREEMPARATRLATRVHAAEALLHAAATTLDEVTRHPKDADAAARGSLALAQAKAFGSEHRPDVPAAHGWHPPAAGTGPPSVQAKWLPRFTTELWIANAYSEVGTKSVNDFNTTVTRDGAGWRLNGRKFYCTGSLAGDITFGPCRAADSDEVTPTDAEGVTIHDDWTGFLGPVSCAGVSLRLVGFGASRAQARAHSRLAEPQIMPLRCH